MSTRVTRRSSVTKKSTEKGCLKDEDHKRKWMTTRRSKLEAIDSDFEDNIENTNTNNKMDPPKTPKNANRRRKLPNFDSSESADEPIPTTPPKQKKIQPPSTPTSKAASKLLDQLTITSPTGKGRGAINIDDSDEEDMTTIKLDKYQNAKKVLNSGETNNLPGRETEIEKLTSFLDDNLNDGTSASMYISGPPGTGKTACLSMLLASPLFEKRLTKVYINCTAIASIGSIYKKICAALKLDVEAHTEKASHAAIEKYLTKQHTHLLLVLDEIDQLCGKRQSILYTIFEWPAKPKSKIILIGIANALDLTDRALARLNTKCELKPQLMHFAPYTKQQISDIFLSRLKEAGLVDIFPPITIQLLAGKVAALSGDVRKALDIGRRVVEMASEEMRKGNKITELNLKGLGVGQLEERPNEMKSVQLNQVVSVLNNVYGASQTLSDDLEDAFPLQQKILICTFLWILKNEKNKDVTIGRLHDVYKRVCNIRNIQCVDQTEFVGLCSLVETRGILRIIKKKEARLSKILLQWDEQEVGDALKDKQLIASILSEQNLKRR